MTGNILGACESEVAWIETEEQKEVEGGFFVKQGGGCHDLQFPLPMNPSLLSFLLESVASPWLPVLRTGALLGKVIPRKFNENGLKTCQSETTGFLFLLTFLP